MRTHFKELDEDRKISPWLEKNYIYIKARWAFIVWGTRDSRG